MIKVRGGVGWTGGQGGQGGQEDRWTSGQEDKGIFC